MDSQIERNTGIGGNNPPEPIEILRAHLAETHTDYLARAAVLLDMEGRLPETMDDDWEAKIMNAIKSCTKFSRASEVTRLAANEPHRALIAATDGFFKAYSDKVDALKKTMNEKYLTPYQQKKKDEEQRRRDAAAKEAARIAADEARKVREENARLAEIKRQEEAAKAEQERIAREAREAQEREERDRQAAAQRAADAKNREEREAAAAHQRELDEIAAADKKRRDAEAAVAQAEQDRLAAARAEQEEAQRKARDEAAVAKQAKEKADREANAKAADMSRTRSSLGAVGSLRTTWHGEVTDEALVPREYLSVNQQKINGAVDGATQPDGTNTLKIPGVRVYPTTSSVVR